jgi:hypothetical protein
MLAQSPTALTALTALTMAKTATSRGRMARPFLALSHGVAFPRSLCRMPTPP